MEWILLVVGVVLGAAFGWWWGRRELGPRLGQAADEVGALTDEKKRLERELRTALERADQTEQQLAASEVAKSESERAGEASMAELEATKHDLAEAERSAKSLGHQLEKAEATRQELAERVTAAEHAAADAHARFDQVTEDYVALKRQARRAEEDREAVHTDRDGTVAGLEAATVEAQREAAELRADHDRLEKALSVATARLQALGGSAEAAAEAQEELRALRTALAGETRRAGELGSELGRTKSELAAREREMAQLRSGSAPRPADSSPSAESASIEPGEAAEIARAEGSGSSAGSGEEVAAGDGASPAQEDATPIPRDEVVADASPAPDEQSPVDADQELTTAGEPAEEPEPAVESETAAAEPETAPVETEAAAEPKAAAEHGAVDDLQAIKGIGPKFEGLLRERNVHTFRHVAELRHDAEWEAYLDTFAGRIEREEWRSQARQLHHDKYGESL